MIVVEFKCLFISNYFDKCKGVKYSGYDAGIKFANLGSPASDCVWSSVMMDEIASHIIDIVANSVTARATDISIDIEKDTYRNLLSLHVKDNGAGMDKETEEKVLDPFYTTKKGKKVGLGVPLLKGTAETTGGTFRLSSVVGQGTEIFATFDLSHPDLPPLGNIRDTMLVLVIGNPDTDFRFSLKVDSKQFVLDTKEIKHLLEGVPINHPEVITFLSKYIDENM